MRKLPGVGVEHGTDWVITHILETELSPIDTDELFEEHIRGCYRNILQDERYRGDREVNFI